MKTKIVFSKKCLEYGPFHVEGPERVGTAADILKKKGYEFLEPQPASEEDLLLVHGKEYIEKVRSGKEEDPDTPAYKDTYTYAALSAGGAILASQIGGFSLMRPPGHHAGREGKALGAPTKGFCYFNNIAVAVRRLRKRILILDIDGHHGNGTEEIFKGDGNTTFISLHRPQIYPGTGTLSEKNCFNFPVESDGSYLKTLKVALKNSAVAESEVIAVSAGFDTRDGDLASAGLDESSYKEIGKMLAILKKKTFFVLEGGYSGEDVGKDIDALLRGFEGF